MKKFLALILCVLMLVPAIPVAATDEIDAYVYGPKRLTVDNLISVTGMSTELTEDGGKTFLHCIAPAGTYGNGTLQFMFKTTELNLMEYPFIKISYRTDSSSHVADTTIRFTGISKESWPASHPSITAGGKWGEFIVNLNTMEKGSGLPGENITDTKLVVKPFGQGSVTITDSKYFDIEYIGCFKTEADAKSYKFEGEENIVIPEKPTFGDDFFFEKATDELIDGYMAEIDKRIEEIKNTPTTVEVTGTKYYVSNLGSDNNDGKSPETPWKTINKVNTADLKAGDGVFFKRGEEWRSSSSLRARGGITYSAYGTGAKPKLNFSIKADGVENWIETEYPNVYKYAGKLAGSSDVGTIVFDGGRAWGIQVHYDTKGTRFVNYVDQFNTLFNGINSFKVSATKPEAPHALENNLEFHHNWETEELFLCSTAGNPGEVFSSIEIVDKGHGITTGSNVMIDNLHIHGAGSHGISAGGITNLTVQNCVLTWIGGSVQGGSIGDRLIRFGNAVEVYGRGDGFTIYNNYASQVYDCCWTIQNGVASPFKNIHFYENVSEFCNSGLEVWQSGGEFENMQLHDNYTRYNGYGWSHQRTNDGGATFFGGDGINSGTFKDCDIYNNVSLFSSDVVVRCGSAGYNRYNFHDNIYVMELNKKLAYAPENFGEGIGSHKWHKYDEKDLSVVTSQGFEIGGKFYYTDPSPYENMFDMYRVENGVNVFEDIKDDFWGRDAIDYVSLKGLFNGVTATTFAPDNTMTRGMLVTVLYRMSGASGYKASSFTDVNENAWFAPGVAWAEANGIVKAGGKFRPDDNATREEMADMLYRYAISQFKYTSASAKTFTDSASINKDYIDGVSFCTATGIIGGYTDGSIKPQNSATRAEVATMIKRFNKFLGETPIDNEKAYEAAIKTSHLVGGEELKSMLDRNALTSVVNADGSVEFKTFNAANGTPYFGVLNMKNTNTLFSDYSALVIEYDASIDTSKLDANFGFVALGGWDTYNVTPITPDIDNEKKYIYIDYTDETIALGLNSGISSMAFYVYPWGNEKIDFEAGESFTVKSIRLFKDKLTAQAYMK